MPKYEVTTDQGKFQVELDSVPNSMDELQNMVTEHLGGQSTVSETKGITPPVGGEDTMSFSQGHPYKEAAMSVADPVLKYGGAIAGEAIAPESGPVGPALGYAAGSRASSRLGEMLGIRKPPPDVSTELADTGKDVATGGIISMGSSIVNKGLEKLLAPFRGTFTPQKEDLMKMADEKGVPLTPAEITQSRGLSKLENFLRNVPSSSGKFENQDKLQSQALTNVAEEMKDKVGAVKDIEDIGSNIKSKVNTDMSQVEAGKQSLLQNIRQSVAPGQGNEATGKAVHGVLKTKSGESWADVGDEYANLPITPETKIDTKTLSERAGKLLEQYTNKVPAFQDSTTVNLLKDLKSGHIPIEAQQQLSQLGNSAGEQRIKDAIMQEFPPSMSWQKLKTLRSDLGQKMSEENQAIKMGQGAYKGLNSPEGGIASQLKKETDTVIQQHSETTGSDLAAKFKEATATAKEFYETFGDKNIKQVLNSNPDRVFDTVMKPGRTTSYNKLVSAVGQEGVQPLKDKLMEKIVGPGEAVSSKQIQSNIAKYGDEMLSTVFGPQGLNDLKSLAMGAKRIEDIPAGTELFKAIARKNPASVFDYVLSPGSSRATIEQKDAMNLAKLKELTPLIGQEGINDLRAKLTDRVLQYNKDQNLMPGAFVKLMDSYGPRTSRAVYGDVYTDMLKLQILAEASRGAERYAANPSGTGQAIVSAGMFGLLIRGITSGLKPAVRALSEAVLLPRGLANLYLSKTGRAYLTKGITGAKGAGLTAGEVTKILSIAGTNNYKIQPEVSQQLNKDYPSLGRFIGGRNESVPQPR